MSARQVLAGALGFAVIWTGVSLIPVPPPVPPACTVEDGSSGPVPCVWIAADHGNRVGEDFIIRADGSVWSLDGSEWLGDVFGPGPR